MPGSTVDSRVRKEIEAIRRRLESLPADEVRALVQTFSQPYLPEVGAERNGRTRAFEAWLQADRAQAHLAAVVDSAIDAIITKDLDGTVQTWNAGAQRIFGYAADEIIGRPVTLLIPADRQGEEREILARINRGERVEHYETVRQRKDTALIHVSVTVSPVIDSHGRIIGASKIARDITEQKQSQENLRASEARYRALFETTLDGILLVDDAGYCVDVNPAFCRLVKAPRERLVGSNFIDWMPPASLEAAKTAFHDLKTRGMFSGKFALRATDGSSVELEWTSRANVLPGLHLCVARDIGARTAAERKLRTEHVLRETIEAAMPAGVASSDLQGRQTYVNPAFCRMVGWAETELLGAMPPYAYWPPEEMASIEDAFAQTLRGEAPTEGFQLRFMRKDGARFDARLLLSPLIDESGVMSGWLASVADISTQLRAQERLSDSEARFRRLAEAMPQIVWTAGPDGIINYINEQWRHLTGLTLEETNDIEAISQVIHPDDAPRVFSIWAERLTTGEPHEVQWRFRHRSGGAYRWFLTRATAVRGKDGRILEWFGSATDIDDQKRTEEALRESEERFRTLADNMAQFAWIADHTGWIHWYNQRWYEYTGTTLEEMQGWGWQKVHHPDHVDRVTEKFRRHVEAGEAWEDTFPLRRRDGEYGWFLSRAVPIRDSAGRIVSWFGTNTDITERRKTEAAMEQLNRDLKLRIDDLQTLLDTAPIGIAVALDPECRDVSINRSGAEMLNICAPRNGANGSISAARLPFRVFQNGRELSPEELPMPYAIRHNVEVRDREDDVVWDDGTRRRILSYATPLHDEAGKVRGAVGISVDITERLRMEEELGRAQKLESIGLLAGGIAHDFNNLLTVIFGNVELAKLYAEGQPDIEQPLTQVEQAFKRARDLSHQLLTFARGGAPVRKTLAIGDLLRECVDFAMHGTHIHVHYDIAENLWPANVDAGQISQAVHNLVINAKDAMPKDGRLLIQACNTVLDETNDAHLPAGRYLEIHVQDSGCGIPEEHVGKVFDPYFTTKSHGTGLGLPTAYSIVNRHGGRLTVQSRPGQGSTFTLFLPASDESPPTAIEQDPSPVAGKGRVLLLDDEEQLRGIGKALVERLGYEVEVAADGREAIEQFAAAKERGAPFSIVILDLTIPGGMGGQECLARLRKIDPDIKAMVSSGYSNDPAMAHHEDFGFQGVVPKPYQLRDLSEALAKLTAH